MTKVRKFKLGLLFFSLMMIMGCKESEEKEDEVQNVDKKASVETELSVQHIDSADVLITKHKDKTTYICHNQ